MIGIYKITSPSNKIYIGQALDIEKRWATYRGLHCKTQPRLYNSFKKYGVDKHKFEVICQCLIEELNEMERYYQDAFCAINESGLNCKLTETIYVRSKLSDETRIKIINSNKGRKQTIEARNKLSISNKGKIISEETKAKISEALKGIKRSIDTKRKISDAVKNMSNETRIKRGLSQKGRIHSIETKHKMSVAKIGKLHSNDTKLKMSEKRKNISIETKYKMSESAKKRLTHSGKIVLHLQTGIFFDNAKIAAKSLNRKYGTFMNMLSGNSKQNKTECIYIS